MMKKKEAKSAQERNDEWDSLTQQWDCIEWGQEQIEAWRQELKECELAMAVHKAAVF